MGKDKGEVVSGLTAADIKEIADKVFSRTDGNRPQVDTSGNGLMKILREGKPDISASPVFISRIVP
ncbi:hypothetical protein AGMMS49928_16460 [Spirochaetia bacterium]|nr:hypothetical protein AGMMS49928_16460 [Spirochaetia bacterium]